MAENTQTIQEVEITMPVRIEMSEAEKERSAKTLAEAVDVNKTLLQERTDMASDYNRRIKENQGVMNHEAGIVRRGFTETETKCVMEYDRVTDLCRVRKEIPDEDGNPVWVEPEWRPATAKERTLANSALQPEIPGTESPDDETEGLETEKD
ncbi:MAG TPA: hypothetical protein ENH84_03855 [Phycisphaerae bacterium]|nr:hypothetical protein [Phycisphaerae bacterium]